jgi:hypothetical protein
LNWAVWYKSAVPHTLKPWEIGSIPVKY